MADGADPQPGQATVTPLTRPGAVDLLTVSEVAAMARVSRMTVYRLVHAGTLPSVQVGRSYRIPARAVRDYLAAAFDSTG